MAESFNFAVVVAGEDDGGAEVLRLCEKRTNDRRCCSRLTPGCDRALNHCRCGLVAIRMRIFISSVRRGLEVERDALPGLIRALGHEPVRFEDFTAQSAPSRQACLDALETCDAYLLLVGPYYGYVFPETGQSATHDEWTDATRRGMPRYVFRKSGVELDAEQSKFAQQLGDYGAGRFYATFKDATALQSEVARVIRELENAPSVLSFQPLNEPVEIHWLNENTRSGFAVSADRPRLEVHVVPLEISTLSRRLIEQLSAGLPQRVRASGLVSSTEALELSPTATTAVLTVPTPARGRWDEPQPGSLASISVYQDGAVAITFNLPGDQMGTILDPQDLATRTAAALRLAGQIDITGAAEVAIGIGLTRGSMVSAGTVTGVARNTGQMRMSAEPTRVEPDERITRAVLDRGADEVGASLARALVAGFEKASR